MFEITFLFILISAILDDFLPRPLFLSALYFPMVSRIIIFLSLFMKVSGSLTFLILELIGGAGSFQMHL